MAKASGSTQAGRGRLSESAASPAAPNQPPLPPPAPGLDEFPLPEEQAQLGDSGGKMSEAQTVKKCSSPKVDAAEDWQVGEEAADIGDAGMTQSIVAEHACAKGM